MTPCPCGSGLQFSNCCGPYLQGSALPPTAEALMRSRYTAFALRDSAYVLASWHASTRPAHLDLSTDETRWIQLRILDAPDYGQSNRAEVDFVADFDTDGKAKSLRERSRFSRENGRWFYVDGQAQWGERSKPGRNDPCPCGSGKKFKKCCAP